SDHRCRCWAEVEGLVSSSHLGMRMTCQSRMVLIQDHLPNLSVEGHTDQNRSRGDRVCPCVMEVEGLLVSSSPLGMSMTCQTRMVLIQDHLPNPSVEGRTDQNRSRGDHGCLCGERV